MKTIKTTNTSRKTTRSRSPLFQTPSTGRVSPWPGTESGEVQGPGQWLGSPACLPAHISPPSASLALELLKHVPEAGRPDGRHPCPW